MKNTKAPQRIIENLNYLATPEDLPLLINLVQKLEEEDESGYFHTDVDKKSKLIYCFLKTIPNQTLKKMNK